MIKLHLDGTREALLDQVVARYPAWPEVDRQARQYVALPNKKEVWNEQAAAIAYLANQYDRPDAHILEIGANRGYTAAVMHFAAPQADVTTLEPDPPRRTETRNNIGAFGIHVRPEVSTTWLAHAIEQGYRYDLIFVDGDHKHVAYDLPFYNLINRGGLFLHHDYSHPDSARACPPVYDNLNRFAEYLDHPLDVLVRDDTGVGLAGFYRKALREVWPPDGVVAQEGGPWPVWARDERTEATDDD